MAFRIEITGDTLAEIATSALALAAQFQVTAAVEPAKPAGKAKKAEPAPSAGGTGSPTTEKAEGTASEPVEEGKPEEPAASAADEAGSASTTVKEPTDAPSEVTYADVQAAVTRLASTKGRDAALATLGEFTDADGEPVKHGSKLAESDWPAAVARLTEAAEA